MKNSELDQLLKGWSDRNRPEAGSRARLEARIRGIEVSAGASASGLVGEGAGGRGAGRWLAAAAGLLILAVGGGLWLHSGRVPEARFAEGNGSRELARLTEEQVSARRLILDEVEALFAGQIRWVRIDADGMRLGQVGDSARAEARGPRLAVRTVIVARNAQQEEWETVWSSDVLTRAEEYVEIAAEAGGEGEMELWVHELPDGRYAVDSEIEWPVAQLARSADTRVLSAGRPERILTQTMAGREYRIYQSIEPLSNGNG